VKTQSFLIAPVVKKKEVNKRVEKLEDEQSKLYMRRRSVLLIALVAFLVGYYGSVLPVPPFVLILGLLGYTFIALELRDQWILRRAKSKMQISP
jgi:Flp pilus assembly protein TadB